MRRFQRYLSVIALTVFGSHVNASLPTDAELTPEAEAGIAQEELQVAGELDAAVQDAMQSIQVVALGNWIPGNSPVNGGGRCRSFNGVASWYGPGFQGRSTANGERFNTGALTAAHRTLPFNTHVRVTNLNNGRTVIVRINDRGPYVGGRVIDLSLAAARTIGMGGTSKVNLETCL